MAAFTPSPRDANALQSVQKFAPPKRLASAWIHASRAVRTVWNKQSAILISTIERGEEERCDATRRTCGVAGLDGEGVEEEVEEDGVAASRAGERWVRQLCQERSYGITRSLALT